MGCVTEEDWAFSNEHGNQEDRPEEESAFVGLGSKIETNSGKEDGSNDGRVQAARTEIRRQRQEGDESTASESHCSERGTARGSQDTAITQQIARKEDEEERIAGWQRFALPSVTRDIV